jgi:hypothetical protein
MDRYDAGNRGRILYLLSWPSPAETATIPDNLTTPRKTDQRKSQSGHGLRLTSRTPVRTPGGGLTGTETGHTNSSPELPKVDPDPDLSEVIERWQSLSDEDKAAILAVIRPPKAD